MCISPKRVVFIRIGSDFIKIDSYQLLMCLVNVINCYFSHKTCRTIITKLPDTWHTQETMLYCLLCTWCYNCQISVEQLLPPLLDMLTYTMIYSMLQKEHLSCFLHHHLPLNITIKLPYNYEGWVTATSQVRHLDVHTFYSTPGNGPYTTHNVLHLLCHHLKLYAPIP